MLEVQLFMNLGEITLTIDKLSYKLSNKPVV